MATLVPATPIKRKDVRSVETMDVKTIDLTLDASQHEKTEMNGRNEISRKATRKENRTIGRDDTDDDDEDLDKPPPKVIALNI